MNLANLPKCFVARKYHADINHGESLYVELKPKRLGFARSKICSMLF